MNRTSRFAAATLIAAASMVVGAGSAWAKETVSCSPATAVQGHPDITVQFCTAVDDGGSLGPAYGYVDKFRYICQEGSGCATYPG